MPTIRTLTLAAALALAGTAASAEEVPRVRADEAARKAVTLTVYNDNFALVAERRAATLPEGEVRIVLEGVPAEISAETLIASIPYAVVIEQSLDRNLVTLDRLLRENLGQAVLVRLPDDPEGAERHRATLLSIQGRPIVKIGEAVHAVDAMDIAFPDPPEGFTLRPTLSLLADSTRAEPRAVALTYLTGGFSWSAEYVANLDEDSGQLQLTGLVSLENRTASRFEAARLRLVAGAVDRSRAIPYGAMARADTLESAAPAAMAAPAEHQAVGDQQLYRVPRPVTLAAQETKQIALFDPRTIPVEKVYRFEQLASAYDDAPRGPVNARVRFRFDNADEGAGPLPAGTLRLYQAAGGDDALFLGETWLDHTPVGAEVEFETASAFDVTGEAKVTAFERLSDKSFESAREITLSNAKDEAVEVEVVGRFPGGWKLLEESSPHERVSAGEVVWTLKIPAGGETRLSYRVRVTRP